MESDQKIRETRRSVSTFTVGCILVLAVAVSGCSTLAKKFKRQKKNPESKEAEFVPVLQPEEYPDKVATPQEMYKYHYSLWQVWQKDLQEALADTDNDKRKTYLLNQVIVETQSITKLLVPEKQKGINDLQTQLSKIRDSLARPAAMRNDPELVRQLESIRKRFHEGYKFEKVQDGLISAAEAAGMSM